MDNLLKEYENTDFNKNNFLENKEKILINFHRSAKVEVINNRSTGAKYKINFIDRSSGATVCSNTISENCWLSTNELYYKDWRVEVFKNDKLIVNHELNLNGKNVNIVFDSKSVGDTIAWIPQVEKFRKTHNCNLYVSTFHNHLFKNSYPQINFFEPNAGSHRVHYEWWIGVYMDKISNHHPTDWRKLPLHQIGAEQLGMKNSPEIKCKIDDPPKINFLEGQKYVCISNSSTAGCKHWQNKNGWQDVVDHLNSIGYKVVLVQREKLPWMDLPELKNVIHPEINNTLEASSLIKGCEFFIGLSSGMSWLAWGLNKKVILISGFTGSFHEFHTPHRLINEDVCNSCWHDTNHLFDRGDWNWCPKNKDFECSKSISSNKVINEINKLV